MAMETTIEVRDLTKRFGDVTALDAVAMRVEKENAGGGP
jgi:ABC-type branched-subunit amino acid transport system ATPase component